MVVTRGQNGCAQGRTKDNEMIVLRPAVILNVVEGSLAGCGAAKSVLAA